MAGPCAAHHGPLPVLLAAGSLPGRCGGCGRGSPIGGTPLPPPHPGGGRNEVAIVKNRCNQGKGFYGIDLSTCCRILSSVPVFLPDAQKSNADLFCVSRKNTCVIVSNRDSKGCGSGIQQVGGQIRCSGVAVCKGFAAWVWLYVK